jgi:hypothetical protein
MPQLDYEKDFDLAGLASILLFIVPCFFPSDTLAGAILTIIWAAFFAYCTYFLGDSLYQKLPVGHDLKIKRFHFNFFSQWFT